MQRRFLYAFFILLCTLSVEIAKGQVDTIFWFAAPDVDETYADAPIYLRISSLDEACVVDITLPANPSIAYSIKLDANSTESINLTSVKSSLETPANTTANNGIKIVSTAKISAYYEVVGTSGSSVLNTEIFAFKGRYALGQKFYTPIQNGLSNSSDNNGYSGFDVVATEDNTSVTITPTATLYGGHTAGVSYSVVLNTGQTYSGRALYKTAAGHPGGTLISSTKPIAVTVKDDALKWTSGNCRDLTGDQIVPVDFVGTEYIVIKGHLDDTERVVAFGTEANTQIYVKGSLNSTIGAGSILPINITDNATYINSTKPVYLLHISGFGCQLGGPILPSIECSGYDQISFTRSTSNSFFLNVMTKAGTQDGFTINGNAGLISASSFTTVPNKTDWVYAQLEFTTSQIPVNVGNIIKNSKGNFQLGLINGSSSSGSACYGYFSGFNQFNPSIVAKDTCLNANTSLSLTDENTLNTISWNFGDPVSGTSNTDTITKPHHTYTSPGTYTITATVTYDCGSKVISRTITIPSDIILNLPETIKTCGDSVILDPAPTNCDNCKYLWSTNSTASKIKVVQPGNYQVKATNSAGCSVIDNVTVYNPFDTWNIDTVSEFCTNGSVVLDALLPDCEWSTGATTQTITVNAEGSYWVIAEKEGCKDTATIVVSERALPEFDLDDSLVFCSNKGVVISVTNPASSVYTYLWSNGTYAQSTTIYTSGDYSVEVKDDIDCKSKDTVNVIIYKLPDLMVVADTSICQTDSAKLYTLTGTGPFTWSTGQVSDTIYVKENGSYTVSVSDIHCTNTDTVKVEHWSLPEVGFDSEEYFCRNDSLILDAGTQSTSYLWSTKETTQSIMITTPGDYFVDLTDVHQCKSRSDVSVYQWELPEIAQIDTMPDSYITITANNGTSPYTYSLNSVDFQESQVFYPVDAGTYTITVKDVNGCHISAVILVNDDRILIPDYFSPNGDGISDIWEITGIESYPEADIKIFDRFGKILVSYTGILTSWNGTYQSKPMPADDYWYIIDLKNRKKSFTGHITLIR